MGGSCQKAWGVDVLRVLPAGFCSAKLSSVDCDQVVRATVSVSRSKLPRGKDTGEANDDRGQPKNAKLSGKL